MQKRINRTILTTSALALAISTAVAQAQDNHAKKDEMARAHDATLNQLAQEKPAELERMALYSSNGDELGDVSDVVRADNGDLYLVISSGGYLGWGDDESAIPLADLERQDDRLILTAADAKAQLENMRYQEDRYQEVTANDWQNDSPANAATADTGSFERSNAQTEEYGELDTAIVAGVNERETIEVDEPSDIPSVSEIDDTNDQSLQQWAQQSPTELEGKPLYAESNEELGEIQSVVKNSEGEIHLVVAIKGETETDKVSDEAVIPLSELERQENQILFSVANAREQLEAMTYDESSFEPVPAESRTTASVDNRR